MKVFKAGTIVKTIIGDIEAMVTSVCITDSSVEYKLRYFSNGLEQIVWLNSFEIEQRKPTQSAGFGKSFIEDQDNSITYLDR